MSASCMTSALTTPMFAGAGTLSQRTSGCRVPLGHGRKERRHRWLLSRESDREVRLLLVDLARGGQPHGRRVVTVAVVRCSSAHDGWAIIARSVLLFTTEW